MNRYGGTDTGDPALIPDEEEEGLLRLLEAVIFAAPEPIGVGDLDRYLPSGRSAEKLVDKLAERYRGRGIRLRKFGDRYTFTTADDLADVVGKLVPRRQKLGRASLDTLAIIAWHQPVTRPEIDKLRGIGDSSSSFGPLIKVGWIKPVGRRKVPGRPLEWATTRKFLDHFGLGDIKDLPGVAELKGTELAELTRVGEPPEPREDDDDRDDEARRPPNDRETDG